MHSSNFKHDFVVPAPSLNTNLSVGFDGLLTHPDGCEHVAYGHEKLVIRLEGVNQVLQVVVVLQTVVAINQLQIVI